MLPKKKIVGVLLLLGALRLTVVAQHPPAMQRVQVAANGHCLVYSDGSPFFWLGDTGWELFHRLSLPEIDSYFSNRQQKGFNVIQAVVLAEFEGLTTPNRNGDLPLLNNDPGQPNEKYFLFVDSVVQLALQHQLYLALLPTWGDKVTLAWGAGPVVFNEKNAFTYGKWIGNRYKAFPNIAWILGGDRPPVKDSMDYRHLWRAMANGILEATDGKAFITYHPSGGNISTSTYLQGEPWLDMNMVQSGHGSGHDVPIWTTITKDWNTTPARPVLDAEPNYEDHPVNPWPEWNPANGYYRDYDVRKQTYRSVFAGACGVTYGHHSVWQFYSPLVAPINHPDRFWQEAINRPGATQVGYLKKLISSRPQLTRIPCQQVIEKGQGEKGEYITATTDSSGSFMMVYLPVGKTVAINTQSLKAKTIRYFWFDPKTGQATQTHSQANKLHIDFTPPTLGTGNDWVLVIDDPAADYKVDFTR